MPLDLRCLRASLPAAAVLCLIACDAPEWIGTAIAAARGATAPGAVKAKPLPGDASTALADKDAALLTAWFEAHVVEGYRKAGHRNPTWDAGVERFLRDSGSAFNGLAPYGTEDLRAQATTLLESRCDDPAVLYFAALTRDAKTREASELFERAFAGMQDAAYPRAVARFVASGLRAEYDRRSEGTGKSEALDPVELRWFKESLTDGSYGPGDDVVLVTHLRWPTGNWLLTRNGAAALSAVEAVTWLQPWARLLFSGSWHVKEAWNSRGQDYGYKVKPEEWKGMAESLAAARRDLTESWRLRPDRPEAAKEMIGVAMTAAEGSETPRLWFDRAVAARLDYMPAYDSLQNALRWRWSGDRDALLAFARECAATRRFDTEVPLFAYRTVQRIQWDLYSEARHEGELEDPDEARAAAASAVLPPSPYKDPEVYELVSTVLMRYRRSPGARRWQRYASYQVVVDNAAERYPEAAKVLDEIGGTLEPEIGDAIDGPLPESHIYALASPVGADVKRADDLYRAGKAEETVALLAKARGGAPERALPYLDHRLASARIEADLAAGRTAALFPSRSLAGWTPAVGAWTLDGDGALVATSDARGHLITGDARVGPDLEVAADIEIASTSNGQFQAGLGFGHDIAMWAAASWTAFRVKKTAHEGEVVYFSPGFAKPAHTISRPVGRTSHVVVQSWNGHLWAYVDGAAVVKDYIPEWRIARDAGVQVAFGGYVNDNTIVVKYRNLRLRRLTAAPAAPSASPSAGAGHATRP